MFPVCTIATYGGCSPEYFFVPFFIFLVIIIIAFVGYQSFQEFDFERMKYLDSKNKK